MRPSLAVAMLSASAAVQRGYSLPSDEGAYLTHGGRVYVGHDPGFDPARVTDAELRVIARAKEKRARRAARMAK